MFGVSAKQHLREFFDSAYADDFDVGADLGGVRLRDDDAAEAEGGGFAGAEIGLRHAADLAEKTHFAEEDDVEGDRPVALRREHRGDDAEIESRLVDLQAAG